MKAAFFFLALSACSLPLGSDLGETVPTVENVPKRPTVIAEPRMPSERVSPPEPSPANPTPEKPAHPILGEEFDVQKLSKNPKDWSFLNDGSEGFLWMVVRFPSGSGSQIFDTNGGTESNPGFGLWVDPTMRTLYAVGQGFVHYAPRSRVGAMPTSLSIVVLHMMGDGMIRLRINGATVASDAPVRDFDHGAPARPLYIEANENSLGRIVDSMGYSKGHSAFVDIEVAERILSYRNSISLNTDKFVDLFWSGNSFMDADASVGGVKNPYPENVSQQLQFVVRDRLLGVSGAKTNDIMNRDEIRIDPFREPNASMSIAILQEAINSLSLGASPNEVRAWYRMWASDRRAAGFKTIVTTMLPIADNFVANGEAVRTMWNGWLREDRAAGFYDELCDFDRYSIGAVGENERSTYFQADRVHPNEQGANLMGTAMASTIRRLVGNLP